MARYRRGSVFVRDLREHSRPLDRNQAARILYLAERLEVATKAKGRRNGALGQTGLAVLRVLVLRFLNFRTGLCSPGYAAIMKATGLCRQAVTDALERLARAGILDWTRRIERCIANGRVVCRQATNLYRVSEPGPWATPRPLSVHDRVRRAFPKRGPLAALAALATTESARKAETYQACPIRDAGPLPYVAPARTDWRTRARQALERATRRSGEPS